MTFNVLDQNMPQSASENGETEAHGIIIGVVPYAERDLILRVLAQGHGKTSIIAKSAKGSSKRFGSLDIFDRGLFRFKAGRGPLYVLTALTSEASLTSLRSNLTACTAASVICEAADLLVKEHIPGSENTGFVVEHALEVITAGDSAAEIFRACHQGLCQLLANGGFLDEREMPPVSAKGVLALMASVEHIGERSMKTRAAVEDEIRLLQRERAKNSQQ